jgi:deazaflavin-dependent oxidoreductase (nitroreductase family)
MAKTDRVPSAVRLGNFFTATLLRAGVKLGTMMLLTVHGRKSGLPRTTPVTLAEYNGQRYLIAPFGEVQWVRNLRAAGAAILSRGRDSEPISVVELPAAEAAPILKENLSKGRPFCANTSTSPQPRRSQILSRRRHAIQCFWCSVLRPWKQAIDDYSSEPTQTLNFLVDVVHPEPACPEARHKRIQDLRSAARKRLLACGSMVLLMLSVFRFLGGGGGGCGI